MKVTIFAACLWLSIGPGNYSPERYRYVDRITAEFPQPEHQQDLALFINSSFTSQNEKVRALHYWISTNIEYDVKNIFNDQEKSNVLESRIGVCSDFVNLFLETASLINLEAHRIDGYSRINGEVNLVPHSWIIVQLDDGQWYCFDPTWSAGYVKEGKFIKQYTDNYFSKTPQEFINTHIPFDPLWQGILPKISKVDFENKQVSFRTERDPDFNESINRFLASGREEQLETQILRMKENGVNNFLSYYYLKDKKRELEEYRLNLKNTALNELKNTYEKTVYQLNNLIHHRNSFFDELKKDHLVQHEQSKLINLHSSTIDLINSYEKRFGTNCQRLINIKTSLAQLDNAITNQVNFVSLYLLTHPEERYDLFTN